MPKYSISLVQSLRHVRLFVTPWTAARQTSLSITNSQSSLKLMSIKLVMPSSHLILYHPLLLLPSIFPSIRVFSKDSVIQIRLPKYWSFSISLSNEYSGLISFRMDWFDFLAVQGIFESLLQHHSSKTSILWCSASFKQNLFFFFFSFQTKPCAHQGPEKGAVTQQETDPDLPVSIQESPLEMWVGSGLLQGWGHWMQQCVHGTCWRRSPLSSLPPP